MSNTKQLISLNMSNLVSLHNSYCEYYSEPSCLIYDLDNESDLEEMLDTTSTLELLKIGAASSNRLHFGDKYFTYDAFDIVIHSDVECLKAIRSFNNWNDENSPINMKGLVGFIEDNDLRESYNLDDASMVLLKALAGDVIESPTALKANRTDEIEASLIKALDKLLSCPIKFHDGAQSVSLHEGVKVSHIATDTYTINEALLCDVDVRVDMAAIFERVIGFKPVKASTVVNISFDECILDKHSGNAEWNGDKHTLNYGHYSRNVIWNTDSTNDEYQEGEVYGLSVEDDKNLVSGVMEALFINDERVKLFLDTVFKKCVNSKDFY
ncbi:hypothetical protein [Psychrobacter sp. AOP31-A1-22]|uniref:hypothetical protein n=1 Tax=Psychrobacter sp. AOP31-A1-22 TaxID=3457696 RepID=UPI0040365790